MAQFSKRSFDAVAYAASRPTYPAQLYQHVLSYASKPAAAGSQSPNKTTLLDLGCGPALSTLAFVPHFDRVVGLDPSQGMVEAARGVLQDKVQAGEVDLQGGKREVSFAQGKGEALRGIIDDASVDLVVAGESSRHV